MVLLTSPLSPSSRLYEPEAGVDQSRALPPGCKPCGPEAGLGFSTSASDPNAVRLKEYKVRLFYGNDIQTN